MNAIHSSLRAARTASTTPTLPHTPGAHQFSGADWIEVPGSMVRQHMLGGAFFLSRGADAFLEAKGLPLDLVLNWFNQPRGRVSVGDSLQMGQGLEAFFGFDEAQDGERAFFVEISLRDSATDH
jgi:hypothetical protein